MKKASQNNTFKLPTAKGYTLIEILVVLAIIGILFSVIIVVLGNTRYKARDTKRKAEISQIARFFSMSCYMPNAGAGEYDLMDISGELKNKYPQINKLMISVPKDPKTGSDTKSGYRYIVSENGQKCLIYANLENQNEPVILKTISSPTLGGGIGVFESLISGVNGSKKYFQYSN